MHLSHPPQELQRHSSCEQGMITQPVRGLQELHTSPSYPDPLTTPQAQPLPSARTSPQRVLIRLKSILPPSYTPLFPQQNPHPSPLVLKYSNALSTEYSQRLIWTIVFLLPVLSSNFVFSHSTSSDAWALQVWTLRQKQILYSDTQIFAGCTFPAIHLQTICANTLFQIHAAVVTYGQSAALPADVHSELPQHELQTAWRNCSINSFRPRSTDWKKVAIKCKHWINMWILLFLCRGKTEQKAWNKFCTIIISSLLLPTSSLLSLVETHNLWFWSLHPSRVLPNSWN